MLTLSKVAAPAAAGGKGVAKGGKVIPITLPAILGRGPLLKCAETKVSRRHATLDWDDNGLLIQSEHICPTFVVVSGQHSSLTSGQSAVLKDGDMFGLLQNTAWYRINLESSQNASNGDTSTSVSIPSEDSLQKNGKDTPSSTDEKSTDDLPDKSDVEMKSVSDKSNDVAKSDVKIDDENLPQKTDSSSRDDAESNKNIISKIPTAVNTSNASKVAPPSDDQHDDLDCGDTSKAANMDQSSDSLTGNDHKTVAPCVPNSDQHNNAADGDDGGPSCKKIKLDVNQAQVAPRTRQLPSWLKKAADNKASSASADPAPTTITKPAKKTAKKNTAKNTAQNTAKNTADAKEQKTPPKRVATRKRHDISDSEDDDVTNDVNSSPDATPINSPRKVDSANSTPAKSTPAKSTPAKSTPAKSDDDSSAQSPSSSKPSSTNTTPSSKTDSTKSTPVKPAVLNKSPANKNKKGVLHYMSDSDDNDGDDDDGGDNDDDGEVLTNSNNNTAVNSTAAVAATAGGAGTSSVQNRPSCQYGDSCYRRNPQHRLDEAHPGEADYLTAADDADLPECEYGVDCYRTNPRHKAQYSHNTLPTRKAKRKAAVRAAARAASAESGDSDDSYDYDDPFLDDGSSDNYEPSDSDGGSDSERFPSQPLGEDEQGDLRRMNKEAKRFMKKN